MRIKYSQVSIQQLKPCLHIVVMVVFLNDYADMCKTHLSRVFCRLNMLPVSCFQAFYVLDLTIEVAQIRAEDGTFQKCTVNK